MSGSTYPLSYRIVPTLVPASGSASPGRFGVPVDPALEVSVLMTNGRRMKRAAWIGAIGLVGVLGSAPAVHAQTADLSVTVTDSPDPVTAGGIITYTVTVTNNGPDAAANVVLLEALTPNSTAGAVITPAGWTCTFVFECKVASLQTGGSAVFTFTETVSTFVPTGTVLTNNVIVTSSTVDPNPANNLAATTTTVNNPGSPSSLLSDLVVTVTGPAGPVGPGQNVTYTITVTNNGPDDSGAGTQLLGFTPPDTTFVSLTTVNIPSSLFTCSSPAPGGVGVIACSLTAGANFAHGLPAGVSAVFTLTVTVMPGTANGVTTITLAKTLPGPIFRTPTVPPVQLPVVDPAPANNQTTIGTPIVVTSVTPPTIAKAFGAASIAVNGTTSLTFTLTNPNTGTALTGVGFTDTLPGGLSVASPNGLTNSCTGTASAPAGTTNISLAGATLAAGSSCTFTVNVIATTAGTKNNTTSAVTSIEGGPGVTASASISVSGGASSIPTLSSWVFALLAMLLAAMALRALRTRRSQPTD
jgi:uncharacterized repeat protein (TIGR01451 family)